MPSGAQQNQTSRNAPLTFCEQHECIMRLLLALLLLLISSTAYGHDAKHPQLDEWYGSLMRPHASNFGGGTSCCSKDDCHTTDAEYRNGKWWARIATPKSQPDGTRVWEPGPFVEVPDEIIVKGPSGNPVANEAGEAVLCHSITWMNGAVDPSSSTLYCFVPPNES
jgi:hypothetical protein